MHVCCSRGNLFHSFLISSPPFQTPPISGWCLKTFGLRARRPLISVELSASRTSRTSGVDPQSQQNLCPHFSSPDSPSEREASHSIPGEVEEDQPLGTFKTSVTCYKCFVVVIQWICVAKDRIMCKMVPFLKDKIMCKMVPFFGSRNYVQNGVFFPTAKLCAKWAYL